MVSMHSLKNSIMKKRNLQKLSLNKKTISKFKQEEVRGGATPVALWLYSKLFCEEKEEEDKEEAN